ncbi:MAG: Glu/Leu/Phe/Val dehydrogenase [Chloroflexi bacterium]|nr:Glu/Leu/Phe/Val dehydrogenase [Chloroflexota bacterium]MYD49167.1 Glu/Leu/Phe/Val dehydrogenase [Chloroflexota bacterium]
MNVLHKMAEYGHEQVTMYSDPDTGLRGIIAIHDTTLGPSCGGTRMWPYASEDEALADALRLSQAMTYKSAAAGLNLGGGKGVIIGDPRADKTEALLRAWGRFVDTLGGRYLTTTDVGTTGRDLESVHQETDHVVGLDVTLGGSGDTSIMTGLGIYMGMKACAAHVWGDDSLRGKTVAMQGFGKVASHTAEHLLEEDARVIATDISQAALDKARSMGVKVVGADDIYDTDCDIFAPCALGGVINAETIDRLRCRIVAGGANNQLAVPEDGETLHRRGIIYAPDFLINAGGIINAAAEIGQPYNPDRSRQQTERIYEQMAAVLATSHKKEISTARAADLLAEQRLASVRQVRHVWRG